MFYKRIPVIIGLIFLFSKGFSQTLYPPKIQSPNVASLGVFGETPVSLFTGTPDISIPLYNLSYGKINMPIALRYHSASVKPGQQPGWVGSGWNLDCGGTITRQIHGKPDELLVTDDNGSTFDIMGTTPYYPAPSTSVRSTQTPGSYSANIPYQWAYTTQLASDFYYNSFSQQYLTNSGPTLYSQSVDAEADEFSFNILGHSGKFYYEGTNKGWKVVSDENIKIEVTDFFTPQEVVNGISERINNGPYYSAYVPSVDNALQSRMFGSFTLTMPDGTKCIFGGRHSYVSPPQLGFVSSGDAPDAVEFSAQRTEATNPNNRLDQVFEINTWHIKKIIDANGNQFTFSYSFTYPTTNKFYRVDNASGTAGFPGGFESYTAGHPFDKYTLYEIMQWPVYLNQIVSPNECVNFNFSTAACNRYSDQQLNFAKFLYDNPSQTTELEGALVGKNVGWTFPNGYQSNIQWEKLDSISVTDYPHLTNTPSSTPIIVPIKKFNFTYSNTAAQRLILGGLQSLDKKSNIVGSYQFTYNSDFVSSSPNLHPDGNYTDHWGFYNGNDLTTFGYAAGDPTSNFSIIPYTKIPNPGVSTTELLNKIVYPTGGATILNWESNDYSQIVSQDRQSLVNYTSGIFGDYTLTGFGGGNRIAEIKNIAADGTVLTDKKYIYKNGYSSGANPSTLSSSGVLNGQPVYVYGYSNLIGCLRGYQFTGGGNYMYSSGNYGYTGQGSPIGYKEVCEVNLDGSYTKHLFTNYDADYNGVTHFDKPLVGSLGWNAQSNVTKNYFPLSTLEVERGKPIATFEYKPDNTLLQKTVLTYRNDYGRFDDTNNYLNLIEKRTDFFTKEIWSTYYDLTYLDLTTISSQSDVLTLASARKVFTYSYYPISKTTTYYNQNGTNPLSVTENYTSYNTNNLLTNKNSVNSKGETISTNYQYPTDFSVEPYLSMVNAHIFSPIIQTTVNNNTSQVSQLMKNYIQPYTGLFVPQNLQIQVGSNTPEIREQINQFDAKGNPLEIQKPNGVKEAYIWGVNYSQILAKIIGANYNDAIALVDKNVLYSAGFSYTPASDDAVRTELNKLRAGLPNALVTTYTYAVGVGITSETDPTGRTIYYNYDYYGRLAYIQDQDRNIIKKFCYNYAGQPENCNSTGFSNQQSYTATFTSNATCAAGTTPATYTYTVPAGAYLSFISQADAEQLAQNALNTNGQTIANSLPCLAAIGCLNSTSMPYTVVFTNTVTGVAYTFNAYPNSSTSTIGSVPVGYYNITMTPYGTTTSNLTFNGSTYSGSTFNLSNINISTANNFTIQTAPSSGPCSFTMSSGYSSPTNSISNNGTTASGYLVFYSTSTTLSQGNSYQIATVNGGCRPSATRSFSASGGGRSWTVTIYSNGQMFVQLAYGSASLTPGSTVSINLSYSL